jgi:geranylgeranyl diphosphate synthase type 3
MDYMENQTSSFEYTLSVMEGLECEIQKQIESFRGNEALSKIMTVLHVKAGNV